MCKRCFDIVLSLTAIIILLPLFLIIAIAISLDSRGGVLYKQKRVGKDNRDFYLYKFRSMYTGSEKSGLLTIGGKDPRVTPVGCFIRKYKIDELPQLFNIIKGDMSFVGPRPEVRKYIAKYTTDQMRVLEVKPGLTDLASLEYLDESEILAHSANPEELYINKIMPDKLALNMKYIEQQSFMFDVGLLLKTIKKIVFR